MKLIKSLAAVIALSLIAVPFARAQELETPTAKATPSPTEKSEAEKSATPAEKSAAKSEQPESSPSAKASPGVAPSAKPAAKGSAESQLKDMENSWEAAIQSHNSSAIEQIMGDGYVMTTSKGKFVNRAGALREFKKDTDTYEKATNSNMVVHMINKDAAVVTGMSHEVGKDKSGKAFNRTIRWTDTFVVRNSKWQCVATQVMLVGQK